MTSSLGPAKQWAIRDKTSSEPFPQIMLSSLIECFLDSAVRNLYELPSGYLKVLSQGYLAAYESKAVKTFEEVPKGVSLDDNFIIFCAESVLDFPGT